MQLYIKERLEDSVKDTISINWKHICFTRKFSLKMGPSPFLFPLETQENFNIICAATGRRNGDSYDSGRTDFFQYT